MRAMHGFWNEELLVRLSKFGILGNFEAELGIMELFNCVEIVIFLLINIYAIRIYASEFLQSTPKDTHPSRSNAA